MSAPNSTVVENVELRVTAPVNPLKGIDAANQKLATLAASIKSIQAQLAGVSTNSMFKLSARQFADRAYTQNGKLGSLSVRQLARRIGFPDSKDVAAVAAQLENEIQTAIAKIQKRIDTSALGKKATAKAQAQIKELRSGSYFTDASAREFQNPTRAGQFFEKYSRLALANKQKGEQALQAILMGTVPAAAGTTPGNLAQAVAAAGNNQTSNSKAQGGPGQSKKNGSRRNAEGAEGGDGKTLTPSGGATVETKVERTPEGPDKTTTVRRTGKYATESAVEVEGQVTKLTARELAEKQVRAELKASLAQLATEYSRQLPVQGGTLKGMQGLRADYTQRVAALLAGKEDHTELGAGFVNQTMPGAESAYRKALDRRQRQMAKRREQALRASDQASQDQAEAEIAMLERRKRGYDKFAAAGTNAQGKIAQARAKTAGYDSSRAQQSLFNTVMTDAAQRAETALQARGARLKGYSVDTLTGRRTGAKYALDEGGFTHTFQVDYSRPAGAVRQVSKELKEAKHNSEMLGGDFIKNTVKVAAWSASVGLLYNSVELVTHSLGRMVEIGYQAARLDQVFRKVGGSTQELTSDVMHLAAVNGRSTEEAMNSALQWSRLGLTRMQVNEAVKISLMAANDAGVGAEETTEHLQAVMQTYGLRVGQLRTLLAELVYVTNNYNVSSQDMLTGLSRTAAAAKQAGLPLAELQGILAATIGSTGQSGANIGNAVKSVTLALSNPALQEKLRTQFTFETTKGGEDIKGMSELLGDLYVKYMKLNDAQRQSLLFSVAGRTQANRLAAMMNSYVQAQTLAINAQLNLNNAEEENTKITSTLKAQLAGVAGEWERFVVIQSNHGPVQVLGEMTVALRNVLTIMNAPGMKWLTTGILAVGAVALARGAMAAVGAKNAAGNGFIGRSGAAVVREVGAVNAAVNAVIEGSVRGRNPGAWGPTGRTAGGAVAVGIRPDQLKLVDRFIYQTNALGQALGGTTGRFRLFGLAAGVALKTVSLAALALSEFIVPIALVGGAIWGFNRIMEATGQTIEATEERMAGFNRQAEKARSAADAYAEAARAMGTFQQALAPAHGSMRPEDLAGLAGKIPDLMGLDQSDEGKRRQVQTAAREQIQAMLKVNDLAGIRTLLDRQQVIYSQARVKALNDEYQITKNTVAVLDAKIRELSGPDGQARPGFGRDARQKNLDQLLAEKAAAQHKGVGLLVEETQEVADSWEMRLQYDDKHLAALEKEKLALASIAEIYNQIATNNPLEKALVSVASLGAQRQAIEQHMAGLDTADNQDATGRAALQDLRQQRQAALDQARDEFQAATAAATAADAGVARTKRGAVVGFIEQGFFGSQSDAWQAQKQAQAVHGRLAAAQAAMEEAQRQLDSTTPNEAGPGALGLVSRAQQRQADIEERKKVAAQEAGTRDNLSLAERGMRFGMGQSRAETGMAASNYGYDEADKLLNERKHLLAEIAELGGKTNKTATDYGRLLKDQNLEYQNLLALRQRHAEVEAQIHQTAIEANREFAKGFFGSGPAEMLRKLAAFRLAQKGALPAGQLYNLSPGMRQDTAQLTGQTPEMNFLRQELGRLNQFITGLPGQGQGGKDPWGDKLDGVLAKLTAGLKDSLKGLDADLLKAMTETVRGATDNLDRLGGSAGRLTEMFDGLTSVIGQLMNAPLVNAGVMPQAFAAVPQSGGWYPGKAH